MVSSVPNFLFFLTGLAILQPSLSQKWKQMEAAQQYLGSFRNSTPLHLNELASELTSNQSKSLECMIFGNEGCSFICDLKCFMYGCVSAGTCTSTGDVCDCRESYRMGNEYVSSRYFRFLPLADLWHYRFELNAASVIVTNFIKEDMKTTQAVGSLLQDPRVTGTQIKNKLMQMFPNTKWLLSELRPIVRGKIDMFLSPSRHFNYPKFTYFLNELVKAKYEDVERMQIKERSGLEQFLQDDDNIKYVVRQLLLFPSEYMQTVMNTFTIMTGVSYEHVVNATNLIEYTSRNPIHQLTSQQIDEIIQAGILSHLLEIETVQVADERESRKAPAKN